MANVFRSTITTLGRNLALQRLNDVVCASDQLLLFLLQIVFPNGLLNLQERSD